MGVDISSAMQSMYQELETFKSKIERKGDEEESKQLAVVINDLLDSASDLKQRFEETPEFSEKEKKLKTRLVALMQSIQEMPAFFEALSANHQVKVLTTFKHLQKSIERSVQVVKDEETKAKRYAYWLLARRSMHSIRLDHCLKDKGYSEEIREKILHDIRQSGLINDSDYVSNFVAKWQKAGKSYRQILEKAKLQLIPTSEIKQVAPDDLAVLPKLIQKRYPQLLEHQGDLRIKHKAMAALVRRGFSLDQIKGMLRELSGL